MASQSVVPAGLLQDRFWHWRQSTLQYQVRITGLNNTGELTQPVTINSVPVTAYEISWGDSSPVEFSGTSHTYSGALLGQLMVSVLARDDNGEIEGSTLITKGATAQNTEDVSVFRWTLVPVIRQFDDQGAEQWFDVRTLATITKPPAGTLRTSPENTPRVKTLFSQQHNFVEGSFTIQARFSHATIHNISGALTVDGRPLPAGATLTLPPVGTPYPALQLSYAGSGNSNIWVWRESL